MTNSSLWRFRHGVRLETRGLKISTEGLARQGQEEMSITVGSADLIEAGAGFLRFVVEYLHSTGRRITRHQTLNYGYWLVRFEPAEDGGLEVWEYDEHFQTLVRGGTLAVKYWLDQREICDLFNANFDPPNAGALTSVSEGVLEGRSVQGVRYNIGGSLSGWLIVTDQYDGDVGSLANQHTYHVTVARPDLAKFLALPCGFRFDQANGDRVWFDSEVAQAKL